MKVAEAIHTLKAELNPFASIWWNPCGNGTLECTIGAADFASFAEMFPANVGEETHDFGDFVRTETRMDYAGITFTTGCTIKELNERYGANLQERNARVYRMYEMSEGNETNTYLPELQGGSNAV